jgi:predicted CopG family antitoxin
MYTQAMATKTISIDVEAYERLRGARLAPNESFSRVIKRAHWRNEEKTAAALLSAMETAPKVDLDILDRLDEAQRNDAPPEDPWQRG